MAALGRAGRRLVGDAWVFDPVGAGARIPALAAALAFAMIAPSPGDGALAAGGAFTVGFGAPLDLRGSKTLLLAVATAVIGVAAVLGSIAGESHVGATVAAGAMGLLCGLSASRGAGPAWIAVQCGLAAVIATGYPADLPLAAGRALPIVAGGLAQTAVLLVARFARRRLPPPPPPDPYVAHYAVHLALALAAATIAARVLGLRNGYWAAMTALLVLRPGGRQTMARALSRVAGTVGGAGLASLLVLATHPGRPLLACLVAAAAFGAYLFQKATYALLSACVTAYVVFLYSFLVMPEEQVAVARILATGLGGAIALVVQGVDWGVRRRRSDPVA